MPLVTLCTFRDPREARSIEARLADAAIPTYVVGNAEDGIVVRVDERDLAAARRRAGLDASALPSETLEAEQRVHEPRPYPAMVIVGLVLAALALLRFVEYKIRHG